MLVQSLDRRLQILARAQRGLFTRAQAHRIGYTEGQIDYRVASAVWVPLRPGIFIFPGAEIDWEAEQLATVVWSRGISSHRAAARLHHLPGFADADFEVTTHDKQMMSRCGIAVHHTDRMPRDHITLTRAIPCTSMERTLLDLGAVASPSRVAVALDHVLLEGLTTLGAIDHCLYLTARRGRRGCRTLRELIKKRAALVEVPNSPLETVIFEFLLSFGLPLPELQVELYDDAGHFIARPDFLYPDRRAVIEGHSKLWHSTPEQRRRDETRHRRLVSADHRVLYITWYDVTASRSATARRVETFLDGGAGDIHPPDLARDVTKEW